jgi:dTDP-4-dehydrorhamnose 3,5-epimerase
LIVEKTSVEGAFLIRPERLSDERGFFARTYCVRELAAAGIDPEVIQRSISYNRTRGTMRGLHYQAAPHEENKFVSCSRGTIYDVVLDLRPDSPTFRRWHAASLSDQNFEQLFIPKGCAHGFLTLTDEVVVQYDISEFHHSESARGLRYDDPAFRIAWPFAPTVVNDRDLAFPPYGSGDGIISP